jgi:hypothetical protein
MRREEEKLTQRREVESEQIEKGESKIKGREAKTERREAVSERVETEEGEIKKRYM